jgi:hypothetical protein
MRFTRLSRRALVAATAATLLAATTAAPVQAEETPSGTSYGSTTVLGLDAGSLLDLRLLGEDGWASLDGAAGTGEALTRLVPVASSLLPSLDALAVEQRSTSGEQRTQADAVNLAGASGGLLGGNVGPASLLAAVDGDGARSLLSSVIQDVSVLAGLLGLGDATVQLGSSAGLLTSDAGRSVSIEDLSVLDISALLALVGLDLTDLSIDQLLGLVNGLGLQGLLASTLGIPVGEVGNLDDLVETTVELVNMPVDDVRDLLCASGAAAGGDQASAALLHDTVGGLLPGVSDPLLDLVDDALDPILDPVTGTLPLDELCAATGDIQDLVNQVLDELLDLINDVVDEVTGLLAGAPLVSIAGVDAGVVATAGATVEDSVARVAGEVGAIQIGNLAPLAGLPLDATLGQVTGLVGQLQGTVDGLLGPLGLDGLVDIGLLEKVTSITEDDGAITAVASLTALRVTVNPVDLCALLTSGLYDAVDSVSSLLGDAGVDLSPITSPVTGVLRQVGATIECTSAAAADRASAAALDLSAVTALTEPLTLTAADVSSTSVYGVTAVPQAPGAPAAPGAPQAPAPASPTLPRTGAPAAILILGAAALGGLGIGTRRLLQRAGGTQL